MGKILSLILPAKFSSGRQVETAYGPVIGKRFRIDAAGREVDAYLGIPFAKPPIGRLRFRKPEPPTAWTEPFQAVKFSPRAIQADFWWERPWSWWFPKDEDCLRVNVFAPAWSAPAEKMPDGFPVMVFIHGGGFVMHAADHYGDEGICRYLCRHDVIVVTVQYRLGLLGFFTTGDANCPGNLGLWDQTEALKWVQLNIRAFGGDPKRVTVFGQSAGGASTDLLTLSPHSRDLFQQAIPMAGNAECDWNTVPIERLLEYCRRRAMQLGFSEDSITNSFALLDFMRRQPAMNLACSLLTNAGHHGFRVGPVMDGDFFPRPLDVLKREAPKRRCMVGTAEYEGLLFGSFLPKPFNEKRIERWINRRIPDTIRGWGPLRQKAQAMYVTDDGCKTKESQARAFIHLFGDIFVNNGTYKYAKRRTEEGHTVYLYSFDHFHPKSFGLLWLWFPFLASTHCTELTYIFGAHLLFSYAFDRDEDVMIELMTKLWTNFAKYGDPNGDSANPSFEFKWQPIDSNHPSRYLSIRSRPEMKTRYADGRPEFWLKLEEEMAKNKVEESKL